MAEPAATAPEILAPAGGPECLPAAVAGGADAVYLGLRHFNARGRAENFRQAQLPDHVAYLHHHGLRCYVVMNTLLHDDEYPKALAMAESALRAGVDAAIIQDLGLWSALGRELPELERHASTQMTVHDPEQIAVLAELGAARVILARELSLAEVAACTEAGRALGVETEHFVHGALCYAFSGQCLISNFAGCRSANRGTCAQNCRFDYRDEAGEVDTALSMKDLSLLHRVGELAGAGVASLKIEGRLKGPDYVYLISRLYRQAVEAWAQGGSFDRAAADEAMRGVFSRGFTDQPLSGRYDEAGRIHRYRPSEDMASDGELRQLDRKNGRAVLRCERRPEPGQGFRFSVGMASDGFLVTASEAADETGCWRCAVRVDRRGPRAPVGTALFRNADHRWREEAATAMRAVPLGAVRQRRDLALVIAGGPGRPLELRATVSDGYEVALTGEMVLQPAESRPLDEAQLADKLGALGETGYRLASCSARLDAPCFLPASELKRLRRQLVATLDERPEPEPRRWNAPELTAPATRATAIWVAVADLDAADAAHRTGAERVWLEGPAAAGDLVGRPWLWLRHPAVSVTDPERLVADVGVVAGHLGTIHRARARGLRVTADHHLNCYGLETLQALAGLGVEAAVLSLECSCREVARVAARIGERSDLPLLALTVHGRLPAMETRQDHGLMAGQQRALQAVERDGGLPYRLERRADGSTILWEGRRLCAPEAIVRTAGLVDAWILELGDCDANAVEALTEGYKRLADNPLELDHVAETLHRLGGGATFPGHLHQGARELDRIAALS